MTISRASGCVFIPRAQRLSLYKGFPCKLPCRQRRAQGAQQAPRMDLEGGEPCPQHHACARRVCPVPARTLEKDAIIRRLYDKLDELEKALTERAQLNARYTSRGSQSNCSSLLRQAWRSGESLSHWIFLLPHDLHSATRFAGSKKLSLVPFLDGILCMTSVASLTIPRSSHAAQSGFSAKNNRRRFLNVREFRSLRTSGSVMVRFLPAWGLTLRGDTPFHPKLPNPGLR